MNPTSEELTLQALLTKHSAKEITTILDEVLYILVLYADLSEDTQRLASNYLLIKELRDAFRESEGEGVG
ncbi:MAG: hypothetical protein AAFX87_30000 [Bacteroidota bacterium]